MLELARQLCPQHGRYQVWIAFFDGEEAVNREWNDPDNRYGSRQMAAKLAMSGDLPKIRAFLLADIVGSRALRIKRDANSDKALTDLVWTTAKNLGYSGVFVNDPTAIEDDHQSFSSPRHPYGRRHRPRDSLLAHAAGHSRQNQLEEPCRSRTCFHRERQTTSNEIGCRPSPTHARHVGAGL